MTQQPTLTIVDASGYLFRAYYGLPKMNAPDGTPVNAIYGFCQMLGKLARQSKGQHLVVALDSKGKGFRHDIYPEYKANRDEPPEDLVPQFSLMREALQAFDLHTLELVGYEADDIIATLTHQAKQAGAKVMIVSSDKDMMQLVDSEKVHMLDPMKNRILDEQAVWDKFGVTPDKVTYVQALAGDSSDNIPGVPKIGPKIAAELINQYGDLETLLSSTHEIKQTKRRENLETYADLARISYKLVCLSLEAPIEKSWEDFVYQAPSASQLLEFFQRMGFQSLRKRLNEFLDDSATEHLEQKQPLPEAEYRLISTVADLKTFVAEAEEYGLVGFDTETDGLGQRAEIVGFSLALPNRKACYVPLSHRSEGLGLEVIADQCPKAQAMEVLKDLLENSSVLKVGQNVKFDGHIVAEEGLQIKALDDTLLMSFVLNAGSYGNGGHGLDALAQRHLDHKMIAFTDLVGKGKGAGNFAELDPEKAYEYACEDADIVVQLHLIFKDTLRQQKLLQVYETLERPLVPILLKMERAGIQIDSDKLRSLGKKWRERLEQLSVDIFSLSDQEFNLSSPKQLGEVLFDKLALKGGKKTRTGQYSTDHSVLESLIDQHPIVEKIITWRELDKLLSTYVDALLSLARPNSGRIHTTYAMTGAQTGRLSSRDPNLQNIPIRTQEGAKIRECFIAPNARKLLSMDYSQIELRLLAEFADIEALKHAFKEGQDIHAMTASAMFDLPIAEVNNEYRRKAKAINFGIIYGISAFGLANQLSISRGEAQQFIERYFLQFPGIRRYMDGQITLAKSKGYVETLFGRRIHLPEINAKNPNRRAHAERQAINAPLQGTAADIIKRAMVKIDRYLHGQSEIMMLLQIHDELVFEVPNDISEERMMVLQQLMETAAFPAYENSVHFKVDKKLGDCLR